VHDATCLSSVNLAQKRPRRRRELELGQGGLNLAQK
jgi:hypothetical protein